MLAEPRPDTSTAKKQATLKLVVDRQLIPARPARRDWSNVVFSVVFCEEARRDFERRNPA